MAKIIKVSDMYSLFHLFKLTALAILILWGCSPPYMKSYQDALMPDEHFRLGLAYEQNKEYDAAVREYKAASVEVPEAHYFLGNIYFIQFDYHNAEKHYKIAIEKLPRDPRAYNNLAWLYLVKKKNLEQAEKLALRAVELAPKDNLLPYRDTLAKIRAEKLQRARLNQSLHDTEKKRMQ